MTVLIQIAIMAIAVAALTAAGMDTTAAPEWAAAATIMDNIMTFINVMVFIAAILMWLVAINNESFHTDFPPKKKKTKPAYMSWLKFYFFFMVLINAGGGLLFAAFSWAALAIASIGLAAESDNAYDKAHPTDKGDD